MFVHALDVEFAIYVTRSGDVFFITEPPEAGSPLSPFPLFGMHTTFARAESNHLAYNMEVGLPLLINFSTYANSL